MLLAAHKSTATFFALCLLFTLVSGCSTTIPFSFQKHPTENPNTLKISTGGFQKALPTNLRPTQQDSQSFALGHDFSTNNVINKLSNLTTPYVEYTMRLDG